MIFTILEASKAQVKTLQNHDVIRLRRIVLKRVKLIPSIPKKMMSAFSSCSILFSGTTQVSGQTIYTAEDRDIRGAETDYKKLEKELDKKIKRTPTDNPGYDEYRYHLDDIEHDPWQLTSFLTTLYDD